MGRGFKTDRGRRRRRFERGLLVNVNQVKGYVVANWFSTSKTTNKDSVYVLFVIGFPFAWDC